jgi:predicted alternative tryptophan synthase beta-subunit
VINRETGSQTAPGAKRLGLEKVILFNLSGHGILDINAYDRNAGGRKNTVCPPC